MRHSQDIGKRERMERAARASIKKMKDRRRATLLKRLQERDRLASLGIPACANCKCVAVLVEGYLCSSCADGLH